jgi:glutathione synthase/RimK-type ligase-like ATP-grasp enzyme
MTKSVLIATETLDTHAIAVELALKERGVQVQRLFGEDFPHAASASFSTDMDHSALSICAPGLEKLIAQKFDVFWQRRPTNPLISSDSVHADDHHAAGIENTRFLDSVWHCLGRKAFWVNPLEGKSRATSKPLQLMLAQEIGFALPKSLISNDPQRIRRFVEANGVGQTIFKTLASHSWEMEDGGTAMSYTVKMTSDSLPSDHMLQTVPGIFQLMVPKAFELRVTYFGDHAIAAKLLTQHDETSALDWRSAAPNVVKVEPYTLPEHIDDRCKKLMRKLGIVFGCFDFIVTPQGEHVFLEVNEMGQFLWVEESAPELPMLDTFADFLMAGKREFNPIQKSESDRVSFSSLCAKPDLWAQMEFDVQHHKSTNITPVAEKLVRADLHKKQQEKKQPSGKAQQPEGATA